MWRRERCNGWGDLCPVNWGACQQSRGPGNILEQGCNSQCMRDNLCLHPPTHLHLTVVLGRCLLCILPPWPLSSCDLNFLRARNALCCSGRLQLADCVKRDVFQSRRQAPRPGREVPSPTGSKWKFPGLAGSSRRSSCLLLINKPPNLAA